MMSNIVILLNKMLLNHSINLSVNRSSCLTHPDTGGSAGWRRAHWPGKSLLLSDHSLPPPHQQPLRHTLLLDWNIKSDMIWAVHHDVRVSASPPLETRVATTSFMWSRRVASVRAVIFLQRRNTRRTLPQRLPFRYLLQKLKLYMCMLLYFTDLQKMTYLVEQTTILKGTVHPQKIKSVIYSHSWRFNFVWGLLS